MPSHVSCRLCCEATNKQTSYVVRFLDLNSVAKLRNTDKERVVIWLCSMAYMYTSIHSGNKTLKCTTKRKRKRSDSVLWQKPYYTVFGRPFRSCTVSWSISYNQEIKIYSIDIYMSNTTKCKLFEVQFYSFAF